MTQLNEVHYQGLPCFEAVLTVSGSPTLATVVSNFDGPFETTYQKNRMLLYDIAVVGTTLVGSFAIEHEDMGADMQGILNDFDVGNWKFETHIVSDVLYSVTASPL